jgi:hypothetical protein
MVSDFTNSSIRVPGPNIAERPQFFFGERDDFHASVGVGKEETTFNRAKPGALFVFSVSGPVSVH